MVIMMNKAEAVKITGGLTYTDKMPCSSYSIPAQKCGVGTKLRGVKGSVCSKCYALRGRYGFPVVKNKLWERYNSLENPKWVSSMVFLIKNEKNDYFRWHDSGDLQSEDHLKKICKICEKTPEVTHWLPTREYYIVQQYIEKGNKIPPNLVIRLSSFMIDGKAPEDLAKRINVQVSGVGKDSYTCPAHKQGNMCRECRSCWNKDVFNVTYKLH